MQNQFDAARQDNCRIHSVDAARRADNDSRRDKFNDGIRSLIREDVAQRTDRLIQVLNSNFDFVREAPTEE